MSSVYEIMPVDYLRALLRRPRPEIAAAQVPELERTLAPTVANERRLEQLRRLTGYPDNGYLPLTWPHIAAFGGHFANLLDRRFPLPLIGTIHIASRLTQHRPIGAGEPLRSVCRLEGAKDTPKGLTFELVTRSYVGSELVWEGAATMLRRGSRLGHGLPQTLERPSLDGIGAANRVWQVPERAAPKFARTSGDLNPIHLSRLIARALGFKGLVIHGMWTLTRAAAMHPLLSVQPGVSMSCDFKLPIILPATVVYRHWPSGDGEASGIEFRVLDRTAVRPHAIGSLRLAVKSGRS